MLQRGRTFECNGGALRLYGQRSGGGRENELPGITLVMNNGKLTEKFVPSFGECFFGKAVLAKEDAKTGVGPGEVGFGAFGNVVISNANYFLKITREVAPLTCH